MQRKKKKSTALRHTDRCLIFANKKCALVAIGVGHGQSIDWRISMREKQVTP